MWPSPGFEVRTGHADGEHVRPHNFRALTCRAVRLPASRLTNIADRIHALQTFSDPGDLTRPGLAFDEVANLSKGTAAACISPQHAAVTGKVENCVTWVLRPWSPRSGRPGSISTCTCLNAGRKTPQRRAQARIPGRLTFATKPELAVEQAKRLMKAGIRVM